MQCMIISMFSAQRAEVSGALSKGIVEWIKPIIEKIFSEKIFSGAKEADNFSLTHLIRKLAHFYNFAVLGILLCTNKKLSKDGAWQSVLWCVAGLLAAIFDEGHQYFVPGRSAEIKDVMIDFSGVMFGMCFLEIFMGIIFKNRGRR